MSSYPRTLMLRSRLKPSQNLAFNLEISRNLLLLQFFRIHRAVSSFPRAVVLLHLHMMIWPKSRLPTLDLDLQKSQSPTTSLHITTFAAGFKYLELICYPCHSSSSKPVDVGLKRVRHDLQASCSSSSKYTSTKWNQTKQ